MSFHDSHYGLGRLIDILNMQKDGFFGFQFLSILGSILRHISWFGLECSHYLFIGCI